jgi:hypothetical protein
VSLVKQQKLGTELPWLTGETVAFQVRVGITALRDRALKALELSTCPVLPGLGVLDDGTGGVCFVQRMAGYLEG